MVDRQLEQGFGRDGISGMVTVARARRALIPGSPDAVTAPAEGVRSAQPGVPTPTSDGDADDARLVLDRLGRRASGRPDWRPATPL